MQLEASTATSCHALDALDSMAGDPVQSEQDDQNEDEGSDNTTIIYKRKLQCQVEGCATNLAIEKAYCIKRRLCNEHMRADAVSCRGQTGLWRFCFQCGKLEPLASFEGNKRSCRTRLAQRKQRETRRCHSDINYRCSRGSSRLPPLGPNSRCSKAPGRHGQASAQHNLLQDMHTELHACLHQPEVSIQPTAVPAASPVTSSPLKVQQAQLSCQLSLASFKEEEFPGFAATPSLGTGTVEGLAGFSSNNSLHCTIQYNQQRSPTPSLPAVPEEAVATDVYTPRVTQQPHQEQQMSMQQTAMPCTVMALRQAPRRVSFVPADTAQQAAGLPWLASGSSMVLSTTPMMSGVAAGCQSAPLPAVSQMSGPSARAAISVQQAASPSPAAGGGEAESAKATSYYSKLLDDLLMEVRADAAVAPAGTADQGLMHLNSLPGDDILQQHTDADLRRMLETALEQAVVVEPLPARQHLLSSQQQQRALVTTSGGHVSVPPVKALQDTQQWQQGHQVVPVSMSVGAGSFSPIYMKPQVNNPLQELDMHSSGSLSQGWVACHSSSTLVPEVQMTDICDSAPAALGSFPMNVSLKHAGARGGGGLECKTAVGPSHTAAAPFRQQQVRMLASHSEKLQRIRQQQALLQQMHSQVALAQAMAADCDVGAGARNNDSSTAVVVKLQQETLDRQLNDMQDFMNFLQTEVMDVTSTARVYC